MITLYWAQLRYDLEQRTYHMGGVRLHDAKMAEVRDHVELDGSNSLYDVAMRFCESGVARLAILLKDKLAPVVKGEGGNDKLDKDKEVWQFELKEGVELDEQAMAMLMHNFVMYFALREWSMAFFPDDTTSFKSKEKEAEDSLTESLYDLGTPKKWRKPKDALADGAIIEFASND